MRPPERSQSSPRPRPRVLALALLAVGACAHEIPEHLQLDQPQGESAAAPLTDVASAVAFAAHGDPLARRPRLPTRDQLANVPDAAPIDAWADAVASIEAGSTSPISVMQGVEDDQRGTPAVALARGYRLGLVEQRVAALEGSSDDAVEEEMLELVSPLRPPPTQGPMQARAFEWLLEPGATPSRADLEKVVVPYAERRALTGWLDGPTIPLAPVGDAMKAEQYDELRQTPMGQLVVARAAKSTGPVDAGLADLTRATKMELVHAAADRDKEQAAWSDLEKSAGKELGTDAPVPFLLERARTSLTAAAGDDRAAGGALLAIEAQRWMGKCPDAPCAGLDRVDAMTASGRFSPAIADQAALWRVVALKDALDTMDVGHDTVMYPRAIVDLLDALLGTGAGPFDTSVLRRHRGDASVWLSLGRAVGADATTDWGQVRTALGAWLEREARAAEAHTTDAETKATLERIATRAVK